MDPVATVIRDEDTSYALLRAANEAGHEVFFADARDLELEDGIAKVRARRIEVLPAPQPPMRLAAPERHNIADLDAVFIRTDPPFNDRYLWMTLVLEAVRGQTLVVNDPNGLRRANEKLYATRFPELMPRTIVSADPIRIRSFCEEVGGRAVIKPVDGHGGDAVFALKLEDSNFNAIVENQTRNSSRVAMVQAFVPEVTRGDKRVLLIDGEPLGAIWRVPQKGDLRSNIHVGGSVEAAEIDEHDRKIIETLSPKLQEDGLFFVGLDVIGGKLTEVNVTSPTGIQQMSRFDGIDYSARVIAWAEARIQA